MRYRRRSSSKSGDSTFSTGRAISQAGDRSNDSQYVIIVADGDEANRTPSFLARLRMLLRIAGQSRSETESTYNCPSWLKM